MIRLTKLNQEEILLNEAQIEYISFMPESKIIMMNKEFFIVTESGDEIIERIIEFKHKSIAESLKAGISEREN